MKKRIVICADGTWNRPEEDISKDFPTNVLRLARAIDPYGADGVPQQVFYDWGIGSYYDKVIGGATGKGLHKNIMDDYRYIVQNYSEGDEIYLFGFSRGAYTVRCLCGLINNCGIVKRASASLIQKAFDHYKKSGEAYAPKGFKSVEFRKMYSHASKVVKFVGVWDTVGAIGSNVRIARHAMAIDEHRRDFAPTIWELREEMDMKQVWFCGSHSDIGGSYGHDRDGTVLSDIALQWMIDEAVTAGLTIEGHLKEGIKLNPLASIHDSRRSFYRIKRKLFRDLDHKKGDVIIHPSVKARWDKDEKYRPANLKRYVDKNGWV